MNCYKATLIAISVVCLISLAAAFSWKNMTKGTADDLIFAVQEGNLQRVQVLLNQGGIEVDTLIDGNATLLIEAVSNNYFDIAKLLIERGANINAQTIAEYSSVLTNACGPAQTKIVHEEGGRRRFQVRDLASNPQMLKYLIERGAKVNPHMGPQPLMTAVTRQDIEVVKILIENGANVNYTLGIKGEGGYSILERAKFPRNEAIYEMLIKAGAK